MTGGEMHESGYGIPLLGDSFPEIEVQTTQGILKLPEAFKGKWFVLFSHPADFTPVCTTEFVAFQKRAEIQKNELRTDLTVSRPGVLEYQIDRTDQG